MARALVFMFLGALLFSFATRPSKGSGEVLEVVSFVETTSGKDDDFRCCELDVQCVDGSVKKMKFKAKKTLVANSIEGFVRSMLPF
jgi:hypothetical protein